MSQNKTTQWYDTPRPLKKKIKNRGGEQSWLDDN